MQYLRARPRSVRDHHSDESRRLGARGVCARAAKLRRLRLGSAHTRAVVHEQWPRLPRRRCAARHGMGKDPRFRCVKSVASCCRSESSGQKQHAGIGSNLSLRYLNRAQHRVPKTLPRGSLAAATRSRMAWRKCSDSPLPIAGMVPTPVVPNEPFPEPLEACRLLCRVCRSAIPVPAAGTARFSRHFY